MNRILLIEQEESDFGVLLKKTCPDVTVISPAAHNFDAGAFDALCILGGNAGEKPLILNAPLRICVDEFIELGKPVFSEFVYSIFCVGTNEIVHTTHHRLVHSDKELSIPGILAGDVLDGHENDCIVYGYMPANVYPVFTYHNYVCAHSNIEMSDEEYLKGTSAMWKKDNLLVCGFRLCNFRRARLVPSRSFESLAAYVIRFLAGEDVAIDFEKPLCGYKTERVSCAADVRLATKRALEWFTNASMLIDGGKGGVKEGFSHHIIAKNGEQRRLDSVRADCTGEVAGAFMLQGLLTGDDKLCSMGDDMFNFVFDYLQVKKGEHKGMIRWTQTAWGTCYGCESQFKHSHSKSKRQRLSSA